MIYVSTGEHGGEPASSTSKKFFDEGIRSVELSGGAFSPTLTRDLKKMTGDIAFQVHNYFPPPETPFVLNLASLDEVVAQRSYDQVKSAVKLALELGMPRYSFHAGFLLDPEVSELGRRIAKKPLYPRATALRCFVDRVLELAHWARSEGVDLLIENNVLSNRVFAEFGENPLLMTDVAEITHVMSQMPENVKLLLDVAHLKVSAHSLQFDARNAIESLGPLTSGYHLSDNDGLRDANEPVSSDAWFWQHLRLDLNYYSLEIYGLSPAELAAQLRLAQSKLQQLKTSTKFRGSAGETPQ